MTKPSRTYRPFDVVIIPFPFSDRLEQRKRPALVLSSEEFNLRSGHLVTAMITSAKQSKWPCDTPISDIKAAGLPSVCLVRMKFYTVDQEQILRVAGTLAKKDRVAFMKNLASTLSIRGR